MSTADADAPAGDEGAGAAAKGAGAAPEAGPQPAPPKKRGLREYVADNIIVLLAMLLNKLRGIVTLPLIVGTIGTAGYGLWSQLIAYVTFLAVVLSWNLHLPLIRFIAADRRSAPRVFSTILLLEMGLVVAGGLLLLPFSGLASDALLGDARLGRHLAVGLVMVFFTNIRLINLNVYRAYDRFLARSVVELAASSIELAIIIVVLVLTHDLLLALVGMTVWAACVAAFSTWHAGRLTGIGRPSKDVARRALAYAVPLLPALLSFWVLDRSNRFFIGHFLGQKEVGVFSASYAIGSMSIYAQMPFQMTLFPKVAALWDTDRATAKRYIELSNKFYLTLSIPFTVACVVVAPRALEKLGNAEIAAQSAILTVLVALGFLLYGVSVMQAQVLHGARRTGVQGGVSVVAAVLNVALNVLLIPRIGLVGSAIATALSYGATCFMLASVARKHLAISYYPAYLARCVVASLVMLAPMAALLPHGTWGLVAALFAGAATYFAALVLLRAFDAQEIDLAKRALRKLRGGRVTSR